MIDTAADLEKYSHIIIPGVGHAGAAMKKLQQTGLVEPIKALQKPVLGICVGMQLLTQHSEEGDAELNGYYSFKNHGYLIRKTRLKSHIWAGIM